jgi:hypothetical protein
LTRPTLALAITLNHATRQDDEWFDEPDDLDRVQRALEVVAGIEDPVTAAAVVADHVVKAAAGQDVQDVLVELLISRHR